MHTNKNPFFKRIKFCFFLSIIIIPLFLMAGCEKKEEKKTSPVDFTVVTDGDIPKELKKLIKERRKNPFELSYSDGSYLYVIKGYGKQETQDYSIKVNDFYMSDDSLVFDTELSGPEKNENVSKKPSYPYIVVKTKYLENSIIFQ